MTAKPTDPSQVEKASLGHVRKVNDISYVLMLKEKKVTYQKIPRTTVFFCYKIADVSNMTMIISMLLTWYTLLQSIKTYAVILNEKNIKCMCQKYCMINICWMVLRNNFADYTGLHVKTLL